MGGSYRQCDECGKRALSIATRCPGCGCEFPPPPEPEESPALELGRFLSPNVMLGVLAAAVVLTAANLGGTSRPSKQPGSFVAPDSIVVTDSIIKTDSVVTADSTVAADSVVSVDTIAAVTKVTAVAPAASASELLVARAWTRVHRSRSKSAALEAMLTPGDTVLADSLVGSWYRVALDGEVLGYARRETLSAAGRTTASQARARRGG